MRQITATLRLEIWALERLEWLSEVNGITLNEAASMAVEAGLVNQPLGSLFDLQVPWPDGPPRSNERRKTELEAQFKAEREERNKARREAQRKFQREMDEWEAQRKFQQQVDDLTARQAEAEAARREQNNRPRRKWWSWR